MTAQLQASDIVWAVLVAVVAWVLGLGIVLLLNRRRPQDSIVIQREPRRRSEEVPDGVAQPPAEAAPVPAQVRDAEDISGVLRWLLSETQADSAAFLRLSPGGTERFVVEPRGLDPGAVAVLAQGAREALVQSTERSRSIDAATRWLGTGGSKAIVLMGTPPGAAAEPLQFARFAIEWMGTSREGEVVQGVEDRVRAVPGVAWAELSEESPGSVRVMLAENIDPNMVEDAVQTVASGAGVSLRWVSPSMPTVARAKLLGLTVDEDGKVSAEVRLEWTGQELRGRAQGAPSPTGRYQAAARAVADALRPLLATDVVVEGLYSHHHHGTELLVAVVSVDEERLVGAVPTQSEDRDVGAARAVLDALNRRLSEIAGGSGRI
ncbi:MAG TPA: hypothetical protein VGZ50_09280 [Actinomycetota bacterium]|nr:hypothetical protein [Actinomycetota bacterium]